MLNSINTTKGDNMEPDSLTEWCVLSDDELGEVVGGQTLDVSSIVSKWPALRASYSSVAEPYLKCHCPIPALNYGIYYRRYRPDRMTLEGMETLVSLEKKLTKEKKALKESETPVKTP